VGGGVKVWPQVAPLVHDLLASAPPPPPPAAVAPPAPTVEPTPAPTPAPKPAARKRPGKKGKGDSEVGRTGTNDDVMKPSD
jgi:hypothetical protein